MLLREKVPSGPVVALTSGEPDTLDEQLSQETVAENGCTAPLGT
jgi:hypothetical protein